MLRADQPRQRRFDDALTPLFTVPNAKPNCGTASSFRGPCFHLQHNFQSKINNNILLFIRTVTEYVIFQLNGPALRPTMSETRDLQDDRMLGCIEPCLSLDVKDLVFRERNSVLVWTKRWNIPLKEERNIRYSKFRPSEPDLTIELPHQRAIRSAEVEILDSGHTILALKMHKPFRRPL